MCLTGTIMKKKLDTLLELKQQIATLKNQADELEGAIKEEMEKNNTTSFVNENYTVTYKDVISNRINTKLFKEENPTMYNLYLKESKYKKFTISDK